LVPGGLCIFLRDDWAEKQLEIGEIAHIFYKNDGKGVHTADKLAKNILTTTK
jgi:hypothetical protein